MANGSRNLIVLSDGTGNSAATPFKTNVWRLYQALDLTDGRQVAVFGDGVGTSNVKILRVLGLALGVGVKRNVLELYKFLCRNYNQGDRIWAFGFSRGAFTIRLLIGLIYNQGLVAFSNEEELQRNALAAYRAYRAEAFATYIPWIWAGRKIRNVVVRVWRRMTGAPSIRATRAHTIKLNRDKIDIAFLGVWDTVVAYGLPVDELTTAVDKWVWPMKFRDSSLRENVQFARHALSLDDERRTFFPIPWCETEEAKLQEIAPRPGRLLQVWFPGVHADVGGGYPDNGLSYVPLCWMIDEAAAKGLKFEATLVNEYRAIAAPTGRLYDSRAGLGSLWRYQPRDAQVLMGKGNIPLVHHSVVTRMTYGNDGYAPISLPERIDVLLPDGSRVGFEETAIEKAISDTKNALSDPATPQETVRLLKKQDALLPDLSRLVKGVNNARRKDLVALVLDTVWWRRLVYFITFALALLAAVFPLIKDWDFISADEDASLFRRPLEATGWSKVAFDWLEVCQNLLSGHLSSLRGLLEGVLPGFTQPWIDAFVENPTFAILILGAFGGSLAFSAFLQRRICDRARAAWSEQARTSAIKQRRLQTTGQRTALAQSTIILLALTIVTTGMPVMSWMFKLFGVLFVLSLGLWIFRMIRPEGDIDPAKPGILLHLARRLRTSERTVGAYRYVAHTLAPITFIVCAAVLVLMLMHRAVFDVQSAAGTYCKSDEPGADQQTADEGSQREKLGQGRLFDTSSLCHATGLRLVAGRKYRIEIATQADWFDKGVRTDVAGFSADSFVHYAAVPLKRRWRENWFQPIARIGKRGNYEHVLTPVTPLAAADFSDCADDDVVMANSPEPPSIALALSSIPAKAPHDYIQAHLDCERTKKIYPAKILISDIIADKSGELFLFVNDAVLATQSRAGLFYRNNSGTATVTVRRIQAPSVETEPSDEQIARILPMLD